MGKPKAPPAAPAAVLVQPARLHSMIATFGALRAITGLTTRGGPANTLPELDVRQVSLLLAIANGEKRTSVIADQLDIAKPCISRATAALEKRGFVRRRRNEDDLRAPILELTTNGARYLDLVLTKIDEDLAAATKASTQPAAKVAPKAVKTKAPEPPSASLAEAA